MLQPNLGSSRHFREWVGNGKWSRVGDGGVEGDRRCCAGGDQDV